MEINKELNENQKKKSFFEKILQKMNQKISNTNIAELILNYNDYCKWPKRIHSYYAKLRNDVILQGSLIAEMEKLMANICERLSLLGNFGNTFRNKLLKQMERFCPSFSSHNWSTDYHPSEFDQQLKKIAEFYQALQKNSTNTKCKVQIQYQNNKKLAQIEERIKVFYQFEKRKQMDKLQSDKNQKFINYVLGPQNQLEFVDRNCLRCTTHFTVDAYTNACHPAVSFFPIDAYELLNYDNFSNIENNVRASMCSMLNEHSGGILLLGCQKQGTTIIPKGLYITQKQKDSLQQKIEGYFAKIYPKVKRNSQVFIDFVPILKIIQNEQMYDDSYQPYKAQAQQGMYVCRIFLLPKQAYKVYLLKASSQHSILEARINNQSITIQDSEHYNYIIQKFQKVFESKQHPGIINCHYNIKCCNPLPGKMAYEQKKQKQIQGKDQQQYYKQVDKQSHSPKKTQKIKENVIKNEDQYKFLTLVVGDKQTMQKLKDCLNEKQKKGIKIQKMFEQSKFKLLKTTWIMYHDQKFQTMKKLAQKHNVLYKNKQLKMIASNVYLQVEDRIQYGQYRTLVDTLKQIYKCQVKQSIQKMIDNRLCTVIFFATLKGSIYAYFYLSDIGYKVKFIRGANHFKQSQSSMIGTNLSYGAAPQPTNQFINQQSTYIPPTNIDNSQQQYDQTYQYGYYQQYPIDYQHLGFIYDPNTGYYQQTFPPYSYFLPQQLQAWQNYNYNNQYGNDK